jgi:four helix bundle protein
MTPNELSDRMLELAARVGGVVDSLPDNKKLARHVAGQLIRCGTAPGPNYEEACAGESRADFVHKLKIVLKELRETRYWLRLIVRTKLLDAKRMANLIDECTQLCNIIGRSIVTAKGIKPKEEPNADEQPTPESRSN